MSKTTIFLAFANDWGENNDNYLEALMEEENSISQIFDELRNSNCCNLIREANTTVDKLIGKFQKHRNFINIFYFSGHAGNKMINLEDEIGESHQVSIEAIGELVKNHNSLKLVFLNGCDTKEHAQYLLKNGVSAVIATTKAVKQYDAMEVAVEFYKSIASNSTVKEALSDAKAVMMMRDASFDFSWELYSRSDKDRDYKPFPVNITKITGLRILHLSNLNYTNLNKIQIDKLLSESVKGIEDVDFVCFTGNLVMKYDEELIKHAYNQLRNLCYSVGVDLNNLFIGIGKNEVDLSKTSMITSFIQGLKDEDQINKLLSSSNDFKISCEPTKVITETTQQHFIDNDEVFINKISDLYSIFFRQVGDKSIGFVVINSLWNFDGTNKLIFPSKVLTEINDSIKKCDYKFLLSNVHPSNLHSFDIDFEYNAYSIFDFILMGQIPTKNKPILSNNMVVSVYTTYRQNDDNLSFSLIDFIFFTKDILIKSYSLSIENNEVCDTIEKNASKLQEVEVKNKQVKLFQTLQRRRQEYIKKGNDLFLHKNDKNKEFIELFTNPTLKESKEEIESYNSPENMIRVKDGFNSLFKIDDNFVIFGSDKCGKSSLLVKVAIELLNFNSIFLDNTIPFYLDLESYKKKPHSLDILKLISNYIESNKKSTSDLLKKINLRLLIDNFDPNYKSLTKQVAEFISAYPHCSYIICGDQTTIRKFELFDYGFNHYKKLFFHDVSRTEIRTLIKKTLNKSPETTDNILERIVKVFNQHRIPFNFWTVSVFLWIFDRNTTIGVKNNSELIELYVQELLGRKELAENANSRFSYPMYKKLLSFLAFKLYSDFAHQVYAASYESIFSIVRSFLEKSKRRGSALPEDVLDYIKEKGILKRTEDGLYSFRLNGVFEYFLATQMLYDKNFLKEVIKKNDIYLSYKNELELYSGFEKDEKLNEKFLKKIYKKTKKYCEKFRMNYLQKGSVDDLFKAEFKESNELTTLTSKVDAQNLTPLTYEEKDELIDKLEFKHEDPEEILASDVVIKKKFDSEAKEHEKVETYLFILGRVFRNIEVEENDEKLIDNEIFTFFIDTVCIWGFQLMESFSEIPQEIIESKDRERPKLALHLIRILKGFIPLVIQGFTYDTIGHITLEKIIQEKIAELELDSSNNQMKLFILYFLLIDIDINTHYKNIDALISILKINTLKSATIIKMLSYLMLKAQGNIKLVEYLKNRLRNYQIQINPNVSHNEIDKQLKAIDKTLQVKKEIYK
ncbi:MAG: CHAT domain-containing protein [Chitinophagales bacterium]